MLIRKANQILSELDQLLDSLSADEYATPVKVLSNATVGQHMRHILEFFECLVQSRETGILNYDNRKRDLAIEQNPAFARTVLVNILNELGDANFDLILQQQYLDGTSELISLPSNYHREIMYNIEHAVHHQALIRIGVQALRPEISLPKAFGVADSTIQYRNQLNANPN